MEKKKDLSSPISRAHVRIAEAQESSSNSLDLSNLDLTALPSEITALPGLEILNLMGNQLTTLPPEIAVLTRLKSLDLDGNRFTALPPEIVALTGLKTLDLRGNQLTALPPEIAALTELESLNLDGNQFTALPPEIAVLTGLKSLDLRDNHLTAFPPEIAVLTGLKSLDLMGNQLTALPPEIAALTELKSLNLLGNQLTALPPEIAALTELKSLSLMGNQLTALPPEIVALTKLESLDLDSNQLMALPPEIAALTRLKTLDLQGNQLTALPPEIAALIGLEEFILDGNQLTALPPEIAALTELKSLNLLGNQLTALPPEIAALTGLKTLDLRYNQLTALPPEIAALTELERLNLGVNQLAALPPEVATLTKLESLDLDGNQLTALPLEIAALTKLESLDLMGNQLTALPLEITALTELKYLDLDGNQFIALPPEIAGLSGLKTLDLRNNQLTALPPGIAGLTRLESLDLENNQLTALPPEIAALAELKSLDLENNQLMALPPEIAALTGLKNLDLQNNELTALPPEIAALTELERLNLDGNQFPNAYYDSLSDGIFNLFAFVHSLDGHTSPIYEAKLLITGEGQVGKSWSLAALQGKKPSHAEGSGNTTWGIDLGDLILPHPKKPDTEIHLNTWDFGGQAVYRITHQFFFSEQAIFLLVWNPRKGAIQCRVREWLRMIALRTGSEVPRGAAEGASPQPRARVIMVATHAEAPGGTYNPEYGFDSLDVDLQAMIVDSIEIDSDTGFNVSALSDMVARHAAELPDMGSPFNTDWAAAREGVLALRDENPWISFEHFAKICAEHNVTGMNNLQTLASTFMNRLGRAVWYGTNTDDTAGGNDALLTDTLVLDAVWLSRAFVQVLEDIPTIESGGMLDHYRFPNIWTEHENPNWYTYKPDEYERLARMMRRFDVALPTRASDGLRSLVPQLVPTIRPSIPWTTPEDAAGKRVVRLACQLDYEAEGLITRFIAATEPYHVYADGTGLFWQEGAFLRDNSSFNNEALVTVQGKEKPFVSIDVSGDQPGFLMNELYRTLESVITFWEGMTRTYYILCPAKEVTNGYCHGRFKFEAVRRRSAKDSSHKLDCQDCDSEWAPDQLLLGLEAVHELRAADHQISYLYHKDKKPCPSIFLLRPADTTWHKVTSWAGFVGKRFELTLVSEFSGKEVASAEFSVTKEWTKWIGPLTRIASVALTGLAVPLDGEIAQQLSEGAATMDKLSALPSEEGGAITQDKSYKDSQRSRPSIATDTQIHGLNKLLQTIGLDPRENGMELVNIKNNGWLWVTVDEAKAHTRPDAQVASKQ